MSFEIYKRLCANLAENGFDIIKDSYDREVISEYSRCCAFYAARGTVDVVVAVMRKEALGDDIYKLSDSFFEEFKRILKNEKMVFIAVYTDDRGDERLREFCNAGSISPDDNYVYMKWLIDTENDKLIINGQQPEKMFSVEKIIQKSIKEKYLQGGSENVSDIMAKKYSESIKMPVPILTYVIIAVYALVFGLMELSGGSENIQTIIDFGGILGERVYSGEYFRLFTAMFVHIGFMHVFSNAFALYIMGSRVERYMGSAFFILCYIFSGICGSAGALFFSPESVTAGGSGAIFGIEGAVAVYTTFKKKKMDGLNYYTALIFVIFGLAIGFMMPNISNAGHLFGLIGGTVFSIVYIKLFPN